MVGPAASRSEVSIGFAAPPPEAPITPRVASVHAKCSFTLQNVCCLLLHCKTHRKLILKRNSSHNIFFPFMTFSVNDSWRKVAYHIMKRIEERLSAEVRCDKTRLKNYPAELFDIYRVQWPQSRQYYTRFTVLIEIESDSTNCLCRTSTSSLSWMGAREIDGLGDKCRGPEVWLFYAILQRKDRSQFGLRKCYEDISVRDAMQVVTNKNVKQAQERNMLVDAKYHNRAVLRLYNEFVAHCYPSRYMTLAYFKTFMINLGFSNGDSLKDYFRTFNYYNTNYLCFDELLFGLAALDNITPHSGPSLMVRLGYIFNYYNTESNGKMSLAELAAMNANIILKNDLTTSIAEETAKSLTSYFTGQISRQQEAYLTQEQFLQLAAANKNFCNLTSTIFRSRRTVLGQINTSFDFESFNYGERTLLTSLIEQNKYSKPCQVCQNVKFRINLNAVRLSLSGEIASLINLQVQLIKTEEKITFTAELRSNDLNTLAIDISNRVKRMAVQIFEKMDPSEDVKAWYYSNKLLRLEAIKKFLTLFKEKMPNEKIVPVSAPIFIINSLHGNLKDLVIYERLIWKTSPHLNQATYLFLGNMVGGQPWNIECILYLFCMKALLPKRFILLRGCQETKEMYAKESNFYKDCHERFDAGVWTLLFSIFDRLPLGAIIEQKLFCSSSGFPRSKKSLQSMNATLDAVLSNPMAISSVRDILSADAFEQAGKNTSMERKFRHFCQINRVCCLIRSHSVPIASPHVSTSGNIFFFNYKVISLYSSSNLQKVRDNVTSTIALVTRELVYLVRVATFLPTWSSLFGEKLKDEKRKGQ